MTSTVNQREAYGSEQPRPLTPDNDLITETQALSLKDADAADQHARDVEQREAAEEAENRANDEAYYNERSLENGDVSPNDPIGNDKLSLGTPLPVDPAELKTETHEYVEGDGALHQPIDRPHLSREPSRSYTSKPIPIVTTYEHDETITKSKPTISRSQSTRESINGSRPASRLDNARLPVRSETTRSVSRAATERERPASRAETNRPVSRAETARPAVVAGIARPASRAGSVAPKSSSRPPSVKAGSVRNQSLQDSPAREKTGRPSSRAGSYRESADHRLSQNGQAAGVGEVLSFERQRHLQHQGQRDQSVYSRPTFDQSSHGRSMSPRPASAFGHRPQPNLIAVAEDGRESRYDDSRAGVLNRSGTVMSRANTLGRNGTLSRATNGGTVGSRRGAFGRGAGASIGTQPEEVLGRDDIHTRAELSERILDEATLRRLSTMEKKDAVRLAKLIRAEAKAEAASVKSSIKELERLSKLQKEAANTERKSQLRLGKWTKREHKARLRFLKEKERYEKVEGELRNAENDYEERRDHAAGLTAQVAEKTQELDDLRGQKAADDREREVKLLALKNPAHS